MLTTHARFDLSCWIRFIVPTISIMFNISIIYISIRHLWTTACFQRESITTTQWEMTFVTLNQPPSLVCLQLYKRVIFVFNRQRWVGFVIANQWPSQSPSGYKAMIIRCCNYSPIWMRVPRRTPSLDLKTINRWYFDWNSRIRYRQSHFIQY